MSRVLLLATTTGYQTRAFGEAAAGLGVELVFATDRCHLIEDPWQDHAIPIRFHDEEASVAAILEAAALRPLDGLLVVGDRPTVIGARVAARLQWPWHPPHATVAARHKLLTRERLRDAGLPVPWFFPVPINHQPSAISHQPLTFPCVLKPVALSGSRGVMRVDDAQGLTDALKRLSRLMAQPDVRAERDEAHGMALIEGFIPGREYAVEGVMHHGALQVLAIFDKPDPLDGPFFEETLYVTPSVASANTQRAIVDAVARAARALGLHHGPVHAECRVPATVRPPDAAAERDRQATGSGQGTEVFVLEVAARPIGGLCARALRFRPQSAIPNPQSAIASQSAICNQQSAISLEELLLRHALGEDPARYVREATPSGVMMMPIPRRGIFRGVEGIDAARAVHGVDAIHVTAKPDQLLVPLPEGASYLGFVFARAPETADVAKALREAHARLAVAIEPDLPLLTPGQIHYNRRHG